MSKAYSRRLCDITCAQYIYAIDFLPTKHKTSGHLLLQKIAVGIDREILQIVSFHPGQILSETARSAGLDENSAPFDDCTSQTHSGDCGCSVFRLLAFTENISY